MIRDEGDLSGKQFVSLYKKYRDNEDANAHTENVVLLAKNFGTPDQLKEALEIKASHDKLGYLSGLMSAKRQELSTDLLKSYKTAKYDLNKDARKQLDNAEANYRTKSERGSSARSEITPPKKLSQPQVKALNSLFEQGYKFTDEIPKTELNKIKGMKDFETFEMDADRYLSEKYFEKQRNSKDPIFG